MDDRAVGIANALASLLVLFTALVDPRISVGVAMVALLSLSIYHLWFKDRR
jgi:hypothetical protein